MNRLWLAVIALSLVVGCGSPQNLTEAQLHRQLAGSIDKTRQETQSIVRNEIRPLQEKIDGMENRINQHTSNEVGKVQGAVLNSRDAILERLTRHDDQFERLQNKPSAPSAGGGLAPFGSFGSPTTNSEPIQFRAKGTFNGLKMESAGVMPMSEWREMLNKQQKLLNERQQALWDRADILRDNQRIEDVEARVTKLENNNWRAEVAKVHRYAKTLDARTTDKLAEVDQKLTELAQQGRATPVYGPPPVTITPAICHSRRVVFYRGCLHFW